MKKYYNKLVRDYIPEIIEKSGKKANYRFIRDKDEFRILLAEKIEEEAKELAEALKNDDIDAVIEELADIRTVKKAIFHHYGLENIVEQTSNMFMIKAEEKGIFNCKIFLESVEDIENERD